MEGRAHTFWRIHHMGGWPSMSYDPWCGGLHCCSGGLPSWMMLLNICDHMAQGHADCMGSLKCIGQEAH